MRTTILLLVSAFLASPACSPQTDGDGDGDADADAEPDSDEAVECDPGTIECTGTTFRRCNETGDGWADQGSCEGSTPVCAEDLGCVLCSPSIERDCDGDTPRTCNATGTDWERGEPCDTTAGEQCTNGYCTDPCAGMAESNSYVGCEYWAVDLPNAQTESGLSPELATFAVVISNGHETATATVLVFADGDDESEVLSLSVGPNDIGVLPINPTIDAAESSISGTGVVVGRAFHIVSNVPVTAYQFNPLNNTEAAYSNDASLLLPVNGLGMDYIVATGDGIVGGDDTNGDGIPDVSYDWGSFVTVVAIEDGTEVTVTPTWELAAGGDIEGGTGPVSVTLDRFDVLNVESVPADPATAASGDSNLSGSVVHSTAPVAVFAGNVAATMPYPDAPCCADHLEEQIIPLSAWGQEFAVGRGYGRRTDESDWEPEYYRITGGNLPEGQDVITLTYAPSAPDGAPEELTTGESVQFASTDSFIVLADGPVLVTNYFVSSFVTAPEWGYPNGTGARMCFADGDCGGLAYAAVCQIGAFGGACVPIGDPSMTIIPPVEQFRDSYVFLVPLDYAYDAITVIGPMGASISLDGQPIEEPLAAIGEIDDVSYGVVRTLVGDGTHRLTTTGGVEVGLIVYGMDKDVSYGYPGGLDLESINPIY
jgi:hypothetical protein